MATPEPIRSPFLRQVRVTSRVGLGMGSGRTVGVNAVPPDDSPDRNSNMPAA